MGSSAPSLSATLPPRLSSRPRSSQQAHQLLGEERVAAAALEELACRLDGQRLGVRAGHEQAAAVSSPERGPRATCVAAATKPAPAPASSSTSGRAVARTSSGTSASLCARIVHEGEHRLVGPVQVLDDEHGRAVRRPGPRGTPARRRSSPRARPPPPRGRAAGAGGRAGGRGRAPSGSTVSRRASAARHAVALEDAGGASDDLGEGPEGDVGAEGQAAALAPGDELGLVVEAAGELGQQAALADAGLADDEGERGAALLVGLVEQRLQGGELLLAADEGGGEAAQLGAGARQRARWRSRRRSGSLLPLSATGWQASKEKTFSVAAWVASPTATAIGGAADLQAGGDVDGVAGEEALARARGRRRGAPGPRRC